jgi:dolichol-phosphate mannosyltransferase
MPKIAVVIPTYNEEKNIEQTIRAVFAQTEVTMLVVVDDASEDNTQKVVNFMQKGFTNLHLIAKSRPRSFSKSYLDGFKYCLSQGVDVIIQMDADASHNPKYIPNMLDKLATCDFVIGSRYTRGGGILHWDRTRKFISRAGNWCTQKILALPYDDLTGGFNCWRGEVISKIDFTKLTNKGYVFLVWMKWNAYMHGFKGEEVPIIFTERRLGRSKFNLRIIFESVWEIIKLRIIKK